MRTRSARPVVGVVALAALVAMWSTSRADEPPVSAIQRLSYTLRGQALTAAEREEVATLARTTPEPQLVDRYIGQWLDRRFFSRINKGSAEFTKAAQALFPLGALSRFHPAGHDDEWIWFLGHKLPQPYPAPAPCAYEQAQPVHPWWAPNDTIKVCPDSYKPQLTFDEAGYCGGPPEPRVPSEPRPECGCGPLLLGCLPGDGKPKLEAQLNHDVRAEIVETAVDIYVNDRPYDELVTTSRTWQSGIVRFLYLRRELLGRLVGKTYTPALEEALRQSLLQSGIDVDAPARWVDRQGIYRGTGLALSTIQAGGDSPTYRVTAYGTLGQYLCTGFRSIHVSAEDVLTTVGHSHQNLSLSAIVRSSPGDSPMQHQAGCRGCHVPLDNAAAFLLELSTSRYGSVPTGLHVTGKLYVNGAEDYRGAGVGAAAFSKLVVQQPEFSHCAVQSVFGKVVGRDPRASEKPLIDKLVAGFDAHGHHSKWLVGEILRSEAFLGTVSQQ